MDKSCNQSLTDMIQPSDGIRPVPKTAQMCGPFEMAHIAGSIRVA